MNDLAFYQCRFFLEEQIRANPGNSDLVRAYTTLIERKTDFDIALCSQSAEVQKNWVDNQTTITTQWNQGQAEIAKTQIGAGLQMPYRVSPANKF